MPATPSPSSPPAPRPGRCASRASRPARPRTSRASRRTTAPRGGYDVWRPYARQAYDLGRQPGRREPHPADARARRREPRHREAGPHRHDRRRANDPNTTDDDDYARPKPIYAVKVSRDARSEPDGSKPAVIYSSTQHAREWLSTETNRRMMRLYIDNYGETGTAVGTDGNPVAGVDAGELTQLVNTRELWFLLVCQPRRLRLHVRVARHAPVAQEPARQRRQRRPHPGRRRRPEPQLPDELGLRRRGLVEHHQQRDLPRPRPRLRAGDEGLRRPAGAHQRGVQQQLPHVRPAAAVSVRVAGEHLRGGRPALPRAVGFGREPGDPGVQPGRRRRALHDQRRHQRPRLPGLRHPVVDAWSSRAATAPSSPARAASSSRTSRPTSRRSSRTRCSSPSTWRATRPTRPRASRTRAARLRTSRSTRSRSPTATRRRCRSRPSARSAR